MINNILKNLAISTKKDIRVVTQIVHHPLKFAKSKITSDDDMPIRIRYFGVFGTKGTITKKYGVQLKVKILLRDNLNTLHEVTGISNKEDLIRYLTELIDTGQYSNINKLYKKVRKESSDIEYISQVVT